MRWRGRRQSTRIEDRRGRRVPRGKGLALGGGGLLLIIVIGMLTGADPLQLLQSVEQSQMQVDPRPAGPTPGPVVRDDLSQFVSVVLADTEETWGALFAKSGKSYELPTLVLFDDAVRSACGFNSAAVGPFYCPADRKVYLDLDFFSELDRRFGAPGDFAQAYVIAHEIGHHVQNLLGISGEIHRLRSHASSTEANQLSVKLELQADCLAGVWGYHANRQRRLLEPGDVEEGLAAAAAIGDDTLQRRSTGTIQPESWTHGSSQQRVAWFRRGLGSGDPAACDPFR